MSTLNRSPIMEEKLDKIIELMEKENETLSEICDWLALIRNEMNPAPSTEVRGFCMPEDGKEQQ